MRTKTLTLLMQTYTWFGVFIAIVGVGLLLLPPLSSLSLQQRAGLYLVLAGGLIGGLARLFVQLYEARSIGNSAQISVDDRLQSLSDLQGLDILKAQLVLEWAELESIVRSRFFSERERQPPTIRLQLAELADQGVLDTDALQRLQTIAVVRNEIVHGLGLSSTEAELQDTLGALRAISNHLHSA